MSDRRLATDLSHMIQDRQLKGRLKRLRKKIKRELKRERNLKLHPKDPQIFEKMRNGELANKQLQPQNPRLPRNLTYNTTARHLNLGGGGGGAAGGSGNGKDDMAFNFQPGFNGMPFPPFMMNGPHFHPPLNITVNALPNPNPRAQMHPSVIQEKNSTEDQEILEPILEKLHEIQGKLGDLSRDANVNLQDKYSILLKQIA